MAKTHPEISPVLKDVLAALAVDPFQPSLRTHKLKGGLAEIWSCRLAFDLRIIFKFVEHERAAAILLLSAGSHEQVD